MTNPDKITTAEEFDKAVEEASDMSEVIDRVGVKMTVSRPNQITVKELEKQIWDIEGVVVVVRAPTDTKVPPYPWRYKAEAGWTTKKFIYERLEEFFKPLGLEFTIF